MIRRLRRLTPSNEEASRPLRALISYYRDNASRMRYDEYLRLGYEIGSGAVRVPISKCCMRAGRQAGMPE